MSHFSSRSYVVKLPEKILPPIKRRKVQLYKASLLETSSTNGKETNTSIDTNSSSFTSRRETDRISSPLQGKEENKVLDSTLRVENDKYFDQVSSSNSGELRKHANLPTLTSTGSLQSFSFGQSSENMDVEDMSFTREGIKEEANAHVVAEEKDRLSDSSSGEIRGQDVEHYDVKDSEAWKQLSDEVRTQLEFIFRQELPIPSAVSALKDLSERNFYKVKKRKAFVMSILRQHSPEDMRAVSPHKHRPAESYESNVPIVVPPSVLSHLPQRVANGLQQVFASGVCHPSKFDDRAMEVLVSLDEADAVQALKEFANVDPSTVRNPSAFWMGIARRYQIRAKKTGPCSNTSVASPQNNIKDNSYGTGSHTWRASNSEIYKQPVEHFSSSTMYSKSSSEFSNTLNRNYNRMDTIRKRPYYNERNLITEYIDELTRRRILAPGVLDERDDALTVLREVEHLDQRRIRNISAFVTGLIRKLSRTDSFNHHPGVLNQTDYLHALDPRVREKYLSLFPNEAPRETGLDHRAFEALSNLKVEHAMEVLDELSRIDIHGHKNISIVAMGIMKRIAHQEDREKYSRSYKH
eukprot:jgi/Galph1/2836/GphlegSOOS_G1544.1